MSGAFKTHMNWPTIIGLIASGGLSVLSSGSVVAQPDTALKSQDPVLFTAKSSRFMHLMSDSGCGLFDDPSDNQQQSQGVVRLARFLTVRGNVTWRADEGLDWSQAVANLPIRQGAQIWVAEGGRAELEFDDGSVLRLGTGSVVTLKTLYSDEEGEFTELVVTSGLVTLRARHDRGVYRLNTPVVSLTTRGPSKVRFGVEDGVEVAVRQGEVTVQGNRGDAHLKAGDYLDLADANSPYDPVAVPSPDSWDRWNEDRDRLMDGQAETPSRKYLPPNVAITANNLDDYGVWRNDPEYGHVWCPRAVDVDWRPYHYGHWTWINPFGWTWVSDEAWGWAPYHYGTWAYRPYGWAWVPGPSTQYWSPAVVHFCENGDRVAWVPLAPAEVHYAPVLAIGFRSGNWAAFFSIGAAAVYYPGPANYCVARPFNTTYVNHVTYVNNVTIINNNTNISRNRFYNSAEYFAANRNTSVQNTTFVPINSKVAAGATSTSRDGFGTRTAYQSVPRANSTTFFTTGRAVGAPANGSRPVAGPASVVPNRDSLTPTRSFVGTSAPSSLSRRVFQAPLPPSVARRSTQVTPDGNAIPSRTVTGNGSFSGGGNSGAISGRPGTGSTLNGNPGRTGVTPGNERPGFGRNSNPADRSSGNVSSPSNGSGGLSGTDRRSITNPPTGNDKSSGGSSAAQAAADARRSLGGGSNRNSDTGGSSSSTGQFGSRNRYSDGAPSSGRIGQSTPPTRSGDSLPTGTRTGSPGNSGRSSDAPTGGRPATPNTPAQGTTPGRPSGSSDVRSSTGGSTAPSVSHSPERNSSGSGQGSSQSAPAKSSGKDSGSKDPGKR